MFDLLTTSPTYHLTLSSYLAGFAGDAVRTALGELRLFSRSLYQCAGGCQFYCNLRNYILYDSILDKWMMFVVNNLARVIMAMSTAFVTLWVLMAGFKMMSGTQREPVIELMFRGAKIIFVLALVSGMMGNTDTIVHTVLGLQSSVATIVTGSSESLDSLIDMNIGITRVISMVTEDIPTMHRSARK
ncbi:MAG: type IV secretion system protein [Burkholderiaceae bacterium]